MFYEGGFHRECNKGSELSEAKPHAPPKATPQTTIGEEIIVWALGLGGLGGRGQEVVLGQSIKRYGHESSCFHHVK